jgi:predicted DNA-binding transcriptional regulator AlpA
MVASVEDLAKLPGWPRLLSQEQAAAYLGMAAPSFIAGVEVGRWPQPLPFGNKRRLWDRHAIDRAVDAMSGMLPLETEEILSRALARHRDEREAGYDPIMEAIKKM